MLIDIVVHQAVSIGIVNNKIANIHARHDDHDGYHAFFMATFHSGG
jgi:hypothetical protein